MVVWLRLLWACRPFKVRDGAGEVGAESSGGLSWAPTLVKGGSGGDCASSVEGGLRFRLLSRLL